MRFRFQDEAELCGQPEDHHQREQGLDRHPLGHEEQVGKGSGGGYVGVARLPMDNTFLGSIPSGSLILFLLQFLLKLHCTLGFYCVYHQ